MALGVPTQATPPSQGGSRPKQPAPAPAPSSWNLGAAATAAGQAVGGAIGDIRNTGVLAGQALGAQHGLIDMQFADANRNLGYNLQDARNGYNLDRSGLFNDNFYGQARLGQQQYRDVDLARQNALNDNLLAGRQSDTSYANANARYLSTWDRANANFGTDTARLRANLTGDIGSLDNRDKFLGQQRDFIGQSFGQALGRAQLGFDANSRQARDAAASAGSATSTGYGDTRSELGRQLGLDQAGARLSRDTDYAGNDRDRRDSGIERTRTTSLFGVNSTAATDQRDFTQRGAFEDRAATNRQADDALFGANNDFAVRMKQLDSLGQEYGLRGQEMESALQLGIGRLGLDMTSTLNRITQQTASNDRQAKAAKDALTQQVLAAAGR